MGFCTKVPSRFNSRRRTQSPRHRLWPRARRKTSPHCAIDSITERTESSCSVTCDHVAISAAAAIATGSSRTCHKQEMSFRGAVITKVFTTGIFSLEEGNARLARYKFRRRNAHASYDEVKRPMTCGD
jgi:hypothetical protein